MKKYLFFVFALIAALLAGCGEKSVGSILDEISGVWGVQGEKGLFSIVYRDKKLSLLVDDNAIPIKLGDIDNENKTVNLNVILENGKPGIWTLRQVWDKEHKSFHLQFTFHDGTRADLTFVRKISTDDLNKIANAEAQNQPNSISAVSSAKPAEPIPASKSIEQPAQTTESQPTPQAVAGVTEQPQVSAQAAPTPSFDCAKAGNATEKEICQNSKLAKLDASFARNYKNVLGAFAGPDFKKTAAAEVRQAQKAWIVQRNACGANAQCIATAYIQRNEVMCDFGVPSGTHPCTESVE